jgi:hypothetical protein
MTEASQKIRQTAYKVPIKAILNNPYVKEEGDFTPNYVKIGELHVSRVNIIAVVLSVADQVTVSMVIDDGTGKISIRGFEAMPSLNRISIGDFVTVIGKPREFNNEKYIVPEIIKKTDKEWMSYRKLELGRMKFPDAPIAEQPLIEVEGIEDSVLTDQERILEFIRENDKGEGVDMDKLVTEVKRQDAEQIIEGMLKDGELFENMPGRVKILE